MDKITRLTELKKLLDDGLLTQEEFDNYKTELISVKSEENKFQQKNVVIETETTKVEENTIIENEAKTTDKQQDEKSQKEYVKKLNDTKTNHSYGRYILAIAFFLGGGFFIFYHFVLKEKWSNEESIMSNEASKANETNTRFTYLREPVDELESGSVTGIKSEQELYNYLDEVAKYWCSEFKKAKQFQNENKRFEEMLKVDRCINAFPLGFTEGVIMPNDLPMELSQKATNYFQNKVVELGFNYSWNESVSEEKQKVSDEEPDETYYWRSSDYNEEQFNREREISESESNQDYYKAKQQNENQSKNSILNIGEIKTFVNGLIKYTVEINSKEELTITKFEPNKTTDGWSWIKRQCLYKNNSIYVDWIDTQYTIKNDMLIVVENGISKKYLLSNSK